MENNNKNIEEIIIVGAGPAGALTGYFLSKAGFKVTVFDRNKEPKRKVCGEYLCPLGVNLLKDLGLGSLLEDFSLVHGMKIVSPKYTPVFTFFPEDGKSSYGVSVNRQVLDSRIRELAKNEGCCFIEGMSVTSIEKSHLGWSVFVGDESYCCDLLIAADGVNSSIAQKLGHKKKGKHDRVALHTYLSFKDSKAHSRLGQMHIFSDGSYVGINPIDQNEVNYSVVCNSDELKENSKEELINRYIKSSPELADIFSLVDKQSKIQVAGSIKNSNSHIAGDGLAYVGDSSGFIDPLTGEGIFNALQSAHMLSQSIITSPNEEALREYKREKIKYFREKNILNLFFQLLIRSPFICERIAKYLNRKQERANVFVGIIGNIYRPLEGLLKMIKN